MSITSNATALVFSADSTIQRTAFVGGKGQVFTSNGTFTIPSGITTLKITVQGGGGGGGNVSTPNNTTALGMGSQGGGGGCATSFLTGLTPGATLAVTVGGGGASAAAGGASSVASGTQTITTITGSGGGAGVGINSDSVNYRLAGGAGGAASNGTFNIAGQTGGDSGKSIASGACFSAVSVNTTGGGDSFMGKGGAPYAYSSTGVNATGRAATGYGGGGGGACGGTANTNNAGGAGSAGIVIFEW